MNHTKCFICTKDVSYQNMHKHLFSAAHSDDIKNALFKSKTYILSLSKPQPILINFKTKSKSFYLCYPCKHLNTALKPHNCNKTEENFKIIKDILNNMTEPTVKEDVKETVSTEEVDVLKKKVNQLQSIADRALDTEDALTDILSTIRDQNFESFKSHMTHIKSSYPDVFNKVYTSLGGEEGQEDEFDEELDEGEVK